MAGTLFAIPDAEACLQRARAAFRSFLRGTDAWLPVNNVGPTAKVLGGSSSEIYQRLDFVGRQAFALYAEGKYLEAIGFDYGITRRPAAPSAGNLVLTAAAALAVANGARLQRSDGLVVTASGAATLSGAGTLTVAVIANSSAAVTNSQPGTPFTVLSGVSGPGAATVTAVADEAGLIGGLDVEPDGLPKTTDLGTLRGRILFRKRNPPQGGCPADYVQWASTVSGVTRVFIERLYNGPGSVRVFPIFDELFAATGGIADDAHIALVRDTIAALQPAAAAVTVVAPTPQVIPINLQGITPNTTPVLNAIEAELADTFQRLGAVAGSDPATPGMLAAMPYLAVSQSFSALWIDQAVANATGNKRAVVLGPTADVVIAPACLPVFSPSTALDIVQ